MIRHDHKSKDVERVKLLNFVETFDCLARKSRVLEKLITIFHIGCDKHDAIILDGVPL